jgi:hypothetical protein
MLDRPYTPDRGEQLSGCTCQSVSPPTTEVSRVHRVWRPAVLLLVLVGLLGPITSVLPASDERVSALCGGWGCHENHCEPFLRR